MPHMVGELAKWTIEETDARGLSRRNWRPFSRLKENLLWVRRFDSIEELRLALDSFKETYNQTWIVERHGYRWPSQVLADQLAGA